MCRRDPKDDLRCIRTAHVQHVSVRKRRVDINRVGWRTNHYTDHVFGGFDESHVQCQAGILTASVIGVHI